jgi:hypothetical protein
MKRASLLVASLAAGAGAGIGTPAQAADWELNPTLEGGFVYDDNYYLTPDGTETDVQGALLDGSLELRARMPRSEFSFAPRVRATYFPDASDANTTDFFGAFNWQFHGQRLEFELDSDIAQQDVVSSEQPDADIAPGSDLGDPVLGDGGRILVSNRRMRGNLHPSMVYELSERKDLVFEADFTDVTFDERVPGAQIGYDTEIVSGGLRAEVSPRSSVTVLGRAGIIDVSGFEPANTYGAQVEWNTRSEKETRAFLRTGAQNTETPSGTNETSWLAGAGISWVLGRNEIFTDLARSVGPSAAGVIVTRDQLRLRFTRALTPRMQFLMGVRGTRDEALDETVPFTERTYATGNLGFQWRMLEELSLRVAYDYTWQKFADVDVEASSSGAFLTLLYQPTTRR